MSDVTANDPSPVETTTATPSDVPQEVTPADPVTATPVADTEAPGVDYSNINPDPVHHEAVVGSTEPSSRWDPDEGIPGHLAGTTAMQVGKDEPAPGY